MLELTYNRLYGEESVEFKKVKSTLFGIYDEYLEKEHGSAATVASDVDKSKNATRVNQQSMDVWKEFETFDTINTTLKKSELEMYLDEQRIDLSQNVQVLDFLKAHAYRYPNLCRMARDVLSIPVSTVASEASFSIGGRILDQYRSTLTPQIVESLICSRDWLFRDSGLQTKEKEAMDAIIEDVISQHNDGEDAMDGED
ncbi:putative HAT dimerization domain, ribonuclease H-like superfamily [Helianthus annuus]|uniref:HAT dimerization domain, ribonuclease H-like superfamily n=2 Tax=Helianthus annuus TaxID=4232 RepID=A0A9K3HHU3_HELAN|nr:putative HAT dimerization domain, ribonuclease H-like superfamily [Helianthus annuus]KAJ0863310.1 putative HAT dimerization domain, ribonuclease H-like superfamily [Helianthus annuus]